MATTASPEKVSAQRIRELNAINESIPKILHAARQVTLALSPSTPSNTTDGSSASGPNDMQAHKDAFSAATKEYFSLVLSVKDALDTQVSSLEEAGIIASGKKSGDHEGLGMLDVAWLNERKGDVGRGFESELMAQARGVIEELVKKKSGNNGDSDMSGTWDLAAKMAARFR